MEKQEILINSQFALFFDQPIQKPENFWQPLNDYMDKVFDQTPIILPVPNDANLNEIPIVQMKSMSGIYSCNISRGRVDFFHAGEGEQKFSDIKDNLIKEVSNLFIFFNDKQTKIKRIGFVTRFFMEDEKQDETISILLNDNFKKIHNGTVYETYIKYVSRDKIKNLKINNYTTIEKFSANISKKGNNIKGVLITRDFNTIPEENYKDEFLLEIDKFIEKSEEKFNLENIKKRTMAKNLANRATEENKKDSSQPKDLSSDGIVALIREQVEPIKDDLNDYKVKMIEVLAIFVALFTFISVDIQIFKSDISKLSALGFTLIMLGTLLIFIIILAYIFDSKNKGTLLTSILITSIVLIAIGIFSIGVEYKGVKKNLETNFYTKTQIDDSKNIKLEEFKKCLKDSLNEKGSFSKKCFEN